ncbi:MAG: hypothetical protein ACODAC_04800 [Pseudomonadota bacterium]
MQNGFLLAAGMLAALPFAGGCQSLDRDELTWQTLHAMDVAQTLSAAGDPCYEEEAWLTRRIIGEQPSESEVLAWGIGTSLMHAWVSDALERRNAPGWLQKAWELGTLGHTTYAVGSNHEAGVRPFGRNREVPGCYRR